MSLGSLRAVPDFFFNFLQNVSNLGGMLYVREFEYIWFPAYSISP